MYIIGIDLSGPSNVSDTALVSFQVEDRELARHRFVLSANDRAILYFCSGLPVGSHAVVGIDAPLSYNIGGGDRPSDTELRRKIIEAGLRPGSVMAPTMIRMVYLTLRGISVARLMRSIQPLTTEIVEVHPGAALALRRAPPGLVSSFKRDEEARWQLLDWLEGQGLDKVAEIETPTDHYVAACAAALAAWKWRTGESAWLHPAEPPIHPFDYAC